MTKYLQYFLFALVLSGLIGCETLNSLGRKESTSSDTKGLNKSLALISAKIDSDKGHALDINNEYILQLGDVLNIKFFYNPKLNELIPIRPDGKISLQLIDEVVAAGLTPAELDFILTENYSKVLTNPEVAVIVKEFVGQEVYVGGEINESGIIPIHGKLTVTQAIFNAGGFKETAHPANVVIIRRSSEGIPAARKINLKKVISGKDPELDIVLKPFDIVYVPKTFIAKADIFVDQYIRQMIPVTLGAGFSYVRGKQRIDDNSTSLSGL